MTLKRCVEPRCQNEIDALVQLGICIDHTMIKWVDAELCFEHLRKLVDLQHFDMLTMGELSAMDQPPDRLGPWS